MPAYALECEASRPQVTAKMFKKKTRIHRNFSVGNLTQLHTGSYRPGSSFVMGLGGGNYGLKGKLQFSVKSQGALSCVKLDKIEGHFTVEPLMMIARDYRKGTCEYNAVLVHERLHVKALLDFQQEYARKFKSRLKKIAQRVNSAQIVSSSQTRIAQQQIQDQINAEIQAYFEQIKPIIQQRQQAIDSPEEYRHVNAKCDNWG